MCALPVQLRHKFLCPIFALTDRQRREAWSGDEGGKRVFVRGAVLIEPRRAAQLLVLC